ncbi:hypothetical protein D3C86_1980530 [compost metagenome]
MGPTDRKGNTMHHQGVTFSKGIQVIKRLAAFHQVVFGEDLEPIHGWGLLKNLIVIGAAQTQSETQIHRAGMHF